MSKGTGPWGRGPGTDSELCPRGSLSGLGVQRGVDRSPEGSTRAGPSGDTAGIGCQGREVTGPEWSWWRDKPADVGAAASRRPPCEGGGGDPLGGDWAPLSRGSGRPAGCPGCPLAAVGSLAQPQGMATQVGLSPGINP